MKGVSDFHLESVDLAVWSFLRSADQLRSGELSEEGSQKV